MKSFNQYLKIELSSLCHARKVYEEMKKDNSFSELKFQEYGKIHFLERALSDQCFLECNDFEEMTNRIKETGLDYDDTEACYYYLASLWSDFHAGEY